MEQLKRGEIYYANLCPIVGSEQGGVRPVVILQNDKGNFYSRTTIAAAITSEIHKTHLPTHVIFTANGMKKKSMVLLEQKYSLQGTTQGNGLTGGLPPVRFSM